MKINHKATEWLAPRFCRLDTSKLENAHPVNGNLIAECPACAESGRDEKGDHLIIYNNGAFGCVLHSGKKGKSHRKRIIKLVGRREPARWDTLDEAASHFSARLTKKVTGTYIYRNGDRDEAFAVVRFEGENGKDFRPFYREGSSWLLGQPPADRMALFNLPDLIADDVRMVFVAEGEKAALAAKQLGLLTTTSPYGAKSAHKADWGVLAGRKVTILPDNDEEGMSYAKNVAAILTSLNPPASVKIVSLDGVPEKGDIVEWLGMRNGNEEAVAHELDALVEATPLWQSPSRGRLEVTEDRVVEDDPGATVLKSRFWDVECEKISPKEKLRKMGDVLISLLHERGKFFFHSEITDHKTAMFFDRQRKLLLRLSDPAFLSWLARFTKVNRSEHEFVYFKSAIEDEALQGDGIVPEAFWAKRDDKIYISNGDGRIVRVTAGNVELVDNGTDKILFAAGNTLPKWELVHPVDPFTCSLFKNANFQASYGIDLLRLWAMSLPANHDCKPPLLLTGQIRSGKTLLIRGIARLFGLPERICEPSPTDEGKRDFWVSINGGGVFSLDNVDSHIKWLPDALSTASTGGSHERKKNYEDTARINLYAKAWVGLTSANPQFASDSGLADRLLIIRMGSRNQTAEEQDLLSEISRGRDAGLSFIAETLSAALADKEPVQNLNKRHPQFAAFALRIGRALGRELETINALSQAEKDKPALYLENDALGSAVVSLIQEKGRFEGTAADLLKILFHRDEATFSKWKPKGVGKKLSASWPHLSELFTCHADLRQNTKYYVIEAK